MRYLVEFDIINPSTLVVSTLYLTTGGQMKPFLPTDASRPNQWYDPKITNLNGLSSFMYGRGRTSGQSEFGSGVITISNKNGEYDYLLTYGYSGRAIRIYYGEGDAFSNYPLYYDGIVDTAEFNYSKSNSGNIAITIRSKKKIFDKDLQTVAYAGTNSGSTGDEGTVLSGLQYKLKPVCFGKVLNLSPVNCNSPGLRYQVHDGAIASIDAVYDNGVALTASGTNPPPAGNYYASIATGIFILGSKPAGQITCDVTGMTVGGVSKTNCSDILYAIVKTYGGLVDTQIDLTALSAFATDASQTIGTFIDDIDKPLIGELSSSTITSVLDSLVDSVGGYWTFNRAGKFTAGMFKVPTTETPIAYYTKNDIIDIELIKSADDNKGIPASLLTLKAVKNFTVQDSGLAGSVTLERTQWLKKDFRVFTRTNSTNKTVYNADLLKITKESLITLTADAETEATRLMSLYSTARMNLRIIVDQTLIPTTLDIASVVSVTFDRFGMSAGKKMTVMGISYNYPKLNQVELYLYG